MLDYTKMSDTENAIMQGISQLDDFGSKLAYVQNAMQNEGAVNDIFKHYKILLPGDDKVLNIGETLDDGITLDSSDIEELINYILMRSQTDAFVMWVLSVLLDGKAMAEKSFEGVADYLGNMLNEYNAEPKEESV